MLVVYVESLVHIPVKVMNMELDYGCSIKNFSLIRLTFGDINGRHLSILVPARHEKSIAAGEVELYAGTIACGTQQEIIMRDEVIKLNHANGFLVPDLSTLHSVTWAGTYEDYHRVTIGAVLCDMHWPDRSPMLNCPRIAVKMLLDRLRDKHGLELYSAFEPEFRLFEVNSFNAALKKPENADAVIAELVPINGGMNMFVTSLMVKYEKYFAMLDEHMNGAGINVQSYITEHGEGQVETPLRPESGVRAGDHFFTYKQAAREIAVKCDMRASFMTQPLPNTSASGAHYNHSLLDCKTKQNVFFDETGTDNLSETARYWLAGLVTHSPSMLALCQPTVNCYRRLFKPWAPSTCGWQIDDRFASLRVKFDPGKQIAYIENRLVSSAGCPYLAMAATLAAGMDGLERRLELQPRGNSADALPNSLKTAMDIMQADQEFVQLLGPQLVDWFCKTKTEADLALLGSSTDSPFDLALERYEYLEFA